MRAGAIEQDTNTPRAIRDVSTDEGRNLLVQQQEDLPVRTTRNNRTLTVRGHGKLFVRGDSKVCTDEVQVRRIPWVR